MIREIVLTDVHLRFERRNKCSDILHQNFPARRLHYMQFPNMITFKTNVEYEDIASSWLAKLTIKSGNRGK